MHPLAVKAPALDHLVIHTGIAELFIKADSFYTAVNPNLIISEFFYPLLGFFDNSAAEVLSEIFGKHYDPSDKNQVVGLRFR